MRSDLLDVNVLIALIDAGHVHHHRAHEWFGQRGRESWATCPITENGFVRIVSQPKYPGSVSVVHAIDLIRSATSDHTHEFWSDDRSITDPELVDSHQLIGHRAITDTYLLALAVGHQGRLITFDSRIGLPAVAGATEDHLLTL